MIYSIISGHIRREPTPMDRGSGLGRRAWTGMLPLLGVHVVNEFYRSDRRPPVTAGLLAANVLAYLRPGPLDSLLPTIRQVGFNPYLILRYRDMKRFFLSPFYHVGEPHLVFNMMSLLWKGIQLESSMGSAEFLSMVATLLGMSQGITLLLARSLSVFFDYDKPYYYEYGVGFSGVLFAMKVILNSQSDEYTSVYGMVVPARYAAWAELILVQMLVPGVSFLGHLGGILAGLLYVRLRRSSSGSDPLVGIIKGIAGALNWPLRFLRNMFRLRRRRISGRGTVGGGSRTGLAGAWLCQACTYENSGWLSVCEMCGTGRRSSGWSEHQFSQHSYEPRRSEDRDLTLEELRRRRIERFGR